MNDSFDIRKNGRMWLFRNNDKAYEMRYAKEYYESPEEIDSLYELNSLLYLLRTEKFQLQKLDVCNSINKLLNSFKPQENLTIPEEIE